MTWPTPGPWKLDKKFGVPVIGIDVHDGGPLLPIVDVVHGKTAAEARKNARLIAAAPDLLAALQGVLRVADRATDEFDAARAAISKAGAKP